MAETVLQTLQDAVVALNNATNAVIAQAAANQAAANQAQTNVTTTINNFLAQPLTADHYCDPVNGNDANDGLTYATAKKTMDSILEGLNTQGANIWLYGDTTISNRLNVYTSIYIYGVQPANTSNGKAAFTRTISFLGTAVNSPSPVFGTMSAGFIWNNGNLYTGNINFALPDVPAAVTGIRSHIVSNVNMNILMQSPTITVGSQAADALFGQFDQGRLTVTISPTLGTGTAGHIFEGIAAGGNPNSVWGYATNLTSA